METDCFHFVVSREETKGPLHYAVRDTTLRICYASGSGLLHDAYGGLCSFRETWSQMQASAMTYEERHSAVLVTGVSFCRSYRIEHFSRTVDDQQATVIATRLHVWQIESERPLITMTVQRHI
jgi:hypothetical protein